MSEILLNLSYSLFLNQTAHSTSIPTYTTSNNYLYCLYRLLLEGGEKGEVVVSALSLLCEGPTQLSSFLEARDCLLRVLKEEPEGSKLQGQLKSTIYRLCCGLGSREMITTYLTWIANEHELSDVCMKLLRLISSECSEFFMHWSVQVCLFGLHEKYTRMMVEGVRLKKREKKRMELFFSLFCEQSKEYPSHANVLLDEEGEWNEGYDTELLPLIQGTFDQVYSFPSECIGQIIGVMSAFCRYLCSGMESTDRSLRETYETWLRRFVSNLSLQKDPGEVMIDLSCLSM